MSRNPPKEAIPELEDLVTERRDFGTIRDLPKVLEIVDDNPGIKVVSFDFMHTVMQWYSSGMQRQRDMFKSAEVVFKRHGIDIPWKDYRTIRNEIWYDEFKRPNHRAGTDFKIFDGLVKIVDHVSEVKEFSLGSEKVQQIAKELEEEIYAIERRTAIKTENIQQTLQGLKDRGKGIVMYSNTPFSSDHIRTTLEDLGIVEYFDEIVASSELALQKSEKYPQGFQGLAWIVKQRYEELQQPGVSSREAILHVGDNRQEDYLGGLNAGLRAVHYDHPGLSKKLFKPRNPRTGQRKTFHPTSGDHKRTEMRILRGSLDDKADERISSIVPAEFRSQEVHNFLQRVYEIGRDIAGPAYVHFAHQRLKGLQGSDRKIAVSLGRDGITFFAAMKKLLEMSPDRYKCVTPEQLRYVTFSRTVAFKAMQDGGFEFPIVYEGREEKKFSYPEKGKDGYKGYKNLLRKLLAQEGFDEADSVRLLDSGLQGTTQTCIQSLFPEWADKIEGRYMYVFRKAEDPFNEAKSGFLLEYKTNEPGLKPKDAEIVRGDKFFMAQRLIYWFEDLFNGSYTSATHLTETPSGLVVPDIEKMKYNEGIEPWRVPVEVRPAEIYQAAKYMAIQGISDSAVLFDHAKTINRSLSRRTFPSERVAIDLLRSHLTLYREYTRGTIDTDQFPDAVVMNSLVRRPDYRKHLEANDKLWKAELGL